MRAPKTAALISAVLETQCWAQIKGLSKNPSPTHPAPGQVSLRTLGGSWMGQTTEAAACVLVGGVGVNDRLGMRRELDDQLEDFIHRQEG